MKFVESTSSQANILVRQTPVLGATVSEAGVTFRLWSTLTQEAFVVLHPGQDNQSRRALNAVGDGLFEATFADVEPGTRYFFDLGNGELPDPYARCCPDGPLGASQVWTSTFSFEHSAPKISRDQLIIYEIHIGTFTPEGTFRAAIDKLPHLRELGINCIELLPLCAFPGNRGWGYDSVALFAPYPAYGSPEDLQALIDAAHQHGMLVLLDMVYNHFGPAGNYLSSYSPGYFTKRHKTPWGDALDYTNPYMRALALGSAEHWLRTYRVDGFRLDATHEIHDESQPHFLEELAAHVHKLSDELGTPHVLFCEDDRNWPGLVTRFHMDGMWADDFHHQTRILLTGERDGYFAAYEPTVAALANCIKRGWTYEGQTWKVGTERQRGNPADDLAARNFVYTIQNHDQIGNRALGDRLHTQCGSDAFLAASTLLLFLPMTPLMFQGQEWMASTPFQYFSDHDGELGLAITKGRTLEFGHFEAFKNSLTTVPDPQAEQTFLNSKLNWLEPTFGEHARVLGLYKQLIHLRLNDPVLQRASRADMTVGHLGNVLWVERRHQGARRLLLVNFGPTDCRFDSLPNAFFDGLKILFAHTTATTRLPAKSAAIFG